MLKILNDIRVRTQVYRLLLALGMSAASDAVDQIILRKRLKSLFALNDIAVLAFRLDHS